MKTCGLFFILIVVGFVLVTGCVLKPTDNGITGNLPTGTLKNPVFGEHLQNLPFGQLNVSIGSYDVRLPVFVDNMEAGVVSAGKMLNLKVVEGNHTVKICAGTRCERVNVEILSGTKTTIDLEERIKKEIPMGTLNVSIGDYHAILPVYIDNSSVGNVSWGDQLSLVVSPGNHSIRICNVDNCYTEDAKIIAENKTTVNFGSRLKSGVRQAELMVSIGGYNAQKLPIFVDNISAGLISQGIPVTIKMNTGVHEVKVCSGFVCIKKQVEVKFGKTNFIDFEEPLKRDAEFSKPTVRIVDYSVTADNLNINAEFINPGTTDLTMTASFSCQYTYINQYHERVSNSVRTQVTTAVKAGNRSVQPAYMWLPGGTDTIASEPVITKISIN